MSWWNLPAYHGVTSLEPGHAITAADLDGVLTAQGSTVRPGDALLVRTGHLTVRRGQWGDYAGGPAPGLRRGRTPRVPARRHTAADHRCSRLSRRGGGDQMTKPPTLWEARDTDGTEIGRHLAQALSSGSRRGRGIWHALPELYEQEAPPALA
ncbi:cyclase family protein [Nonomuraea sp. WAC 01424]|uniref:cyclase family protein n=1 Tax=Nonomuraea sp. WAC 01424 TaxID=2203200 RepID=UPI00163CE576|nr:cyclase family protein [Nonomuraea sp. WAC 01424]